ncbi:MlaD family protein [Marinimicrobium sp. C2-29]|uniref:MlaD family protein n=1 Tax=Marinimicrobium sp. C2-29 TaxID=3139825 RepID=UPI00313986F2
MSKQTNPTVVGAFVIGAVVFLALGFALFGGSELLAKKVRFTTYFEGSVQGLRVGSNILFRGVRVGSVNNIELLTEVETLEPVVRVTMQLDPESVKTLRGNKVVEGSLQSLIGIERLLEAGLSAQLASESFVTGQLAVELDFRPDRELKLRGTDSKYPEIPGIQSDVQQVLDQFQRAIVSIQENVDLGELARDVHGAASGLNELANSTELRETISGVNRLVNSDEAQRLAGELMASLVEVREAAISAEEAFEAMERDTGELAGSLKPAAERLNGALTEAERMLQAVQKQLKGNTGQAHQLQSTLAELEATAQSARTLFDYLQRHPEALLKGKSQ